MKTIAWILWLGMSAIALLSAVQLAHAQDALPLNPDVTSENIAETICVPGWTKTVRPPVSFTNEVKRREMNAAGIDWSNADAIELDHRIPLALGGAPRDERNLALQVWSETAPDGWKVDSAARVKDRLERFLQVAVCEGRMTLQEAQACIHDDWRACAAKFPAAH